MYATAKDLMKTPAVTPPTTELPDVAATMETKRISLLPVVDDAGRLCGVISKTDLLHICLEHEGTWQGRTAEEAMSPAAISVAPSASLMDVAALMQKNSIHHVLVIENERLAGIISALDLAEPMLKAYEMLRNTQSR